MRSDSRRVQGESLIQDLTDGKRFFSQVDLNVVMPKLVFPSIGFCWNSSFRVRRYLLLSPVETLAFICSNALAY